MREKEKSLFDTPEKRWAAKQILYKSLLEELHNHFLSINVRYIPIKGAYLILSGLSEKISQREMVDVDLVVEKKNFKKVVEYFNNCSNAQLKDDDWYFEQPFFYKFGALSILVEIHYEINRPERFFLPAADIFSRALRVNECLYFPSSEDALAIALCHSVVHIAYGGFRYDVLNDIEAITASSKFSRSEFMKILDKTGIKRFVEFVFIIYAIKKRKNIEIGLRRPLYLKAMAGLFVTKYESMPKSFRRLFFEIPFVRQPFRLVIISLSGK